MERDPYPVEFLDFKSLEKGDTVSIVLGDRQPEAEAFDTVYVFRVDEAGLQPRCLLEVVKPDGSGTPPLVVFLTGSGRYFNGDQGPNQLSKENFIADSRGLWIGDFITVALANDSGRTRVFDKPGQEIREIWHDRATKEPINTY